MSTASHQSPPAATQAGVPAAFDPFLRDPEQPIRYHWWTRWADHHAGTIDARHTPPAGPRPASIHPSVLDTAWLARLFYERDTAIRAEQRTTAALIAVLAAQITTTSTHRDTLSAQITDATDHLEALQHADPDRRVPTASERAYSTDAEIATRSANSHAQAVAGARAQLAGLEAGIRADQIHIAGLTRDIASHHHLLAIRTLHLTAWYQSRAATYTRAHTARTKTIAATPCPDPPDYLPETDQTPAALAGQSTR